MTKLQLTRSPPFSVPLRFFLTAPLFGIVAAALIAWGGGEAIAGRWSPQVLAITHLLTLGFMAMVMIGALFQVFPVVLGVDLPWGRRLASLVHGTLTLGTALLASGFLLPAVTWLMAMALTLLSAALLLFLASAGVGLLRQGGRGGMRLAVGAALIGLLVTATLGVLLGVGYGAGFGPVSAHGLDRRWTDLHALWGLLGWAGLLVVAIAYEVVPMFQATPPYPRWMQRGLSSVLLGSLALWSLAFVGLRLGDSAEGWSLLLWAPGLVLGLAYGVFALTTLRLQLQRKRPEPDLTLLYWRLGMSCLMAGIALGGGALALGGDPVWLMLATLLVLLGFAVSVINGMLYKILPFLVWLHLTLIVQAQGRNRREIPPVKALLPWGTARAQLVLHLLALVLLGGALVVPSAALSAAAASALGASFALLGWNLLAVLRHYRAVRNGRGMPVVAKGQAGSVG
ncbi:MAG: permease [Bdellovibrio bacteriovorus]